MFRRKRGHERKKWGLRVERVISPVCRQHTYVSSIFERIADDPNRSSVDQCHSSSNRMTTSITTQTMMISSSHHRGHPRRVTGITITTIIILQVLSLVLVLLLVVVVVLVVLRRPRPVTVGVLQASQLQRSLPEMQRRSRTHHHEDN